MELQLYSKDNGEWVNTAPCAEEHMLFVDGGNLPKFSLLGNHALLDD